MEKRREYRLSDFEFHVKGRWRSRKRQVVEVRYQGTLLGSLDLGPARWAVFAALVQAAFESCTAEFADPFLTNNEIADLLQSVESPFAHASYMKGYLHDLRTDLDVFLRAVLGESSYPGGWGAYLIRTHTLGYYLAVPKENLRLTPLDRRRQLKP